jgi:hypothetical protein
LGAKRRKVIWLSAERWKHGTRRFHRRRCGSGRALLLPFTHRPQKFSPRRRAVEVDKIMYKIM